MNGLAQRFKKAGAGLLSALRRFPVAIALAAGVMALALLLIHREQGLTESAKRWMERVLLTMGLGIPLSVSLQLLLERLRKNGTGLTVALWTALAALLALYMLFLLRDTDSMIPGIRYMALLLASVAIVPAVPYLPNRQGDERFALKLLLRLLVTGVFTGILIGGVDLVLLMLDKLLAVKLWDHAYMDVAAVSAGLFAPAFFLAGVPGGDTDWEREPFQPLVKILFGYIVFPLLVAYTAIVYAYSVRILILWSWPSNTLVNLVLWYTVIGVAAVYFMRTQGETSRWFRLADAWYPRLTVLPIALAFAGILIRIGAYGFTEPRFFVLALAVWVAASTALAVFVRPDKRMNAAVPALLAALAALAVLGPFSAFAVSSASQNARLETVLRKNGMLTAGKMLTPNSSVPEEDRRRVYDILDYFGRTRGLGAVKALPAGTDEAGLPSLLGFGRPDWAAPGRAGFYITAAPRDSALDVAGYDYLFTTVNGQWEQAAPGGLMIKVDSQSVFTVARGGSILYSKDLKEYARGYEASWLAGKTSYTRDELTKEDENAGVRVKFLFDDISMDVVNGNPVYSAPAFTALVDMK